MKLTENVNAEVTQAGDIRQLRRALEMAEELAGIVSELGLYPNRHYSNEAESVLRLITNELQRAETKLMRISK